MNTEQNSTLSLKNRKPYSGVTVNKRKQEGQRGPKRHFDKPAANKATYSHEAHLNELHGKKVEVCVRGRSQTYVGTLVGYDAFSLTIEDAKGLKSTIFKGAIDFFNAVQEIN